MKLHKWIKISIHIKEPFQDLLVGQLTLIGFNGFVQEENSLNCFMAERKWTDAVKTELQSILARFKSEFPSVDPSYGTEIIREENWNKSWEKQTGIVEATSKIVIKPSWKKLQKKHKNKIILHVDPKMSFGTGHHETTRLSLKLLEQYVTKDLKVLDFGCGTGVLGIACIKLGARSVMAVDIDPWSIENTKENIKRNKVEKRMKVRLGSISSIPKIKYDLIAANIDFITISRFIKSIAGMTRKNGIVMLSGILTADLPALQPLFKNNTLVTEKLIMENEWSAAALRRM